MAAADVVRALGPHAAALAGGDVAAGDANAGLLPSAPSAEAGEQEGAAASAAAAATPPPPPLPPRRRLTPAAMFVRPPLGGGVVVGALPIAFPAAAVQPRHPSPVPPPPPPPAAAAEGAAPPVPAPPQQQLAPAAVAVPPVAPAAAAPPIDGGGNGEQLRRQNNNDRGDGGGDNDDGRAGDGADEEVWHCRVRGKWLDALLLAGTCVTITLTLLNTPSNSSSSGPPSNTIPGGNTGTVAKPTLSGSSGNGQDYDWCLRLIVLLTVKYTFTILLLFTQLVVPIVRTRNFPCHAAFYAADCGVAVFLILLISLSTRNAPSNPSGNAPCACTCMPNPATVWTQVAWLCVTCVRVVWILMFSVYRRAALQADAREEAELNAQIAASEVAAAAEQQHPRRTAAMQLRDQLRGLSDAELATIPSFVYRSSNTTTSSGTTTTVAPPPFVDPRSPNVDRPSASSASVIMTDANGRRIAWPPEPPPLLTLGAPASAAPSSAQLNNAALSMPHQQQQPPPTLIAVTPEGATRSVSAAATQAPAPAVVVRGIQLPPAVVSRDGTITVRAGAEPTFLTVPVVAAPPPPPPPSSLLPDERKVPTPPPRPSPSPTGSERERGDCCAICLDELSVGNTLKRLVRCGHVFHSVCIDAWLRTRNQCPYCRAFAVTRNGNH